ncbi:ComEC/Rec2 family competence protein [Moraxella canis]|uniref:ComEC/Rec2 family competence protein n=1 Tax=Moraxella canis TaxID=90239 RepID=UPI000669698E|nr:ComEC/Rec2 family competence protein [Moraxella canis]
MAVWLFAFVSLAVLAILGSIEQFWFNEKWLDILSSERFTLLITAGVLLCLFGWQLITTSGKAKLSRLIKAWMLISVVLLFVMRTLVAYVAYELHTPSARYIVSADAHIHTLSDDVYDEVLGTSFRQVATLHNLKPVTASTHHASHLKIYNPFGGFDHDRLEGLNQRDLEKLNAMEGMTVLLSANPNFTKADLSTLTEVQPATRLATQIVITPIDKTPSASGFDTNQWLRTRHVHAQANILSVDEITPLEAESFFQQFYFRLERFRYQLRAHFYQDWHELSASEAQARAVSLSLMTGDRALIDKNTKELYQLAGISHLLAISGTHVLFLAVILSALVTFLTDKFAQRIYTHLPRWQIRMMVMVAASLVYALFTGFDVPAVRTVYLLIAAWLVRYLILPAGMISMLAWVALVMIWLDPYVLWQAGFWLSFIAVLLLMRYETSKIDMMDHTRQTQGRLERWGFEFRQATRLQFWLFFSMLPVSILLFGKVSIWGLVVNLFAIGLFGFVIVPINLIAGAFFGILPELSQILWGASSAVLYWLHDALYFGLSSQIGGLGAWLYAPFGMAGFLLSFMVVGLWILPNVLPRALIILPVVAMIFLVLPKQTPRFELIILPSDTPNISQALLIYHNDHQQKHWLILNDLGANTLRANHTQTLTDQLYRLGAARHGIDGVIVQSPSSIFLPVVGQLAKALPVHRFWQAGNHEPLANIHHTPCSAGLHWQSEGISIKALTGWHEISDERVQHCEIEVLADLPLSAPDLREDETESDLGQADVATSNQTQLIISTNREPLLWQLWDMLCLSDDRLNLATPLGYHSVWLSTTRAADASHAKANLDAPQLLYLDK